MPDCILGPIVVSCIMQVMIACHMSGAQNAFVYCMPCSHQLVIDFRFTLIAFHVKQQYVVHMSCFMSINVSFSVKVYVP